MAEENRDWGYDRIAGALAFAEHWVRSVKEECLSKVILLSKHSLRRALNEFVEPLTTTRSSLLGSQVAPEYRSEVPRRPTGIATGRRASTVKKSHEGWL
jgi:hypothetical protein